MAEIHELEPRATPTEAGAAFAARFLAAGPEESAALLAPYRVAGPVVRQQPPHRLWDSWERLDVPDRPPASPGHRSVPPGP